MFAVVRTGVTLSSPTKSKRVEYVYAGVASHDGEVVHAYYEVTTRGDLADQAFVYPQPLGDFPPGAVCSFMVQPSGAVLLEDAKFERMWPDAKLVATWIARHSVTSASEAAWSSKELPQAFAYMEPMRAAYRTLKDEELRGVLLAQMVRYIVSPDD